MPLFNPPSENGSSTIIFQPGGTASPNVYIDEASLATATQSLLGPYTILFDLSVAGGAYTFTTIGSLNLAPFGTWTDGGLEYKVFAINGTIIYNPPICIDGSLNVFQSQVYSSLFQPTTEGYTELRGLTATITDGYQPIFDTSGSNEWDI